MKIVESIKFDGENQEDCIHFGDNPNIIGADEYGNVDVFLDSELIDVEPGDFIVKFEDGNFAVLTVKQIK